MFKTIPARMPRLLAIAATALSLAGSAWCVPDAQFEPAFAQFTQANNGGDSAAIDAAAGAFEALHKVEPGNPVLMAYLGAATALKARATFLPWKKMGYSEDGLALVDKALAMLTPAHDAPLQHATPAALEVSLTAASTYLAMPDFMNRGARGAKLLAEVLGSPLLASSPLAFRGAVWMTAARQAAKDQRGAEARRYFNEVVAAGAPQADAARAQLKELKS